MNNPKDDIFSFLGRQFANSLSERPRKLGETSDNKAMFAILGILAFVGVEAVKIIYRKNFGMSMLAWVRFALCILCFAGVSIISFICFNSTDSFSTESGSPKAHLASGIVFAILTIIILIKGITGADKNAPEHYNGNSNVLSFLIREGWREKTVQHMAEPLLTLLIGIFLCTYDYFGGAAILFCALSSWLNVAFDFLFPPSSMEEKLNDLNSSHNQKASYKRAQSV